MRLRGKLIGITAFVLTAIVAAGTMALAQRGGRGGGPPNPVEFLKRALTEAGASALTSEQESQLNTLFTNFKNAQPTEPDDALKAAHDAYNTAVLAGDLEAAQAQASVIASRAAELNKTRMQATAKFQIDVLAVLKAGGQLDALKTKFGDRLLRLLGPLSGGPPFGRGPGGSPGFRPEGGPGFGHRRPGGSGQN